MAGSGHVLAERHDHRHEADHGACDRSEAELHHDAGSDGSLTGGAARIALPASIDLALVAARDPDAQVTTLGGETMGTRWTVKLAAAASLDLDPLGRAIAERLRGIIAEMSHWDAGSSLSRFNRSAPGTWTTLPPDFAHVVAAGLGIAEISEGAFDPAVGRIVDLWGFGPVAANSPPCRDALEKARALSGWRRLAFDRGARRLHQPGGLSLDLSAIAKGHAVDIVGALLAEHGHAHALVEIGGELAGRGVRPDGQPWWVDLETPPDMAVPLLRVALHGLAVATSGDYRRGSHNLDPRTGKPPRNGVVSVSVVHASAMVADAWATALTVLGPDDGMGIADRNAIAARMIVAEANDARELISPALAAMLSD